ncbi:MAG TPA: phospholipase D-like domain-containing protein [Mycobacterium sp.]|uniref:phospholipase D-like domain-containing protein n=1 Tax=Mycobacterium sp. TaxID=1785 RepID=UPI002B7F4158|nr:phospholipase D-like domain-containing protein [Mycobacterium sp.]HME74108.1 phospholipase D-like domain-containing protein [Mycobacterium sp.]
MPVTRATSELIAVNAFRGDAKTLLAFDLSTPAARDQLAGFTIEVRPPSATSYYVENNLRLGPSQGHAQVAGESPFSSVNAPIHKFRWVHVPGLVHQDGSPTVGTYTYVVTPRYFDDAKTLQALDTSTSVTVDVEVAPFQKGSLTVGFTRGYVQSQAFVRHFGPSMHIRPDGDDLIYDTGAVAGSNGSGQTYSYNDEYQWLGFTARQQILDVLAEVQADPTLSLDMFAYDLNEPEVCSSLLKLGASGQIRIILDNAALHHNAAKPTPEDNFADEFTAQAADALKRGKFGRYAHDKILIVSDKDGPRTVLTGSTNFSVTGLYVNANHVLTFDDREVATTYSNVFNEAWSDDVKAAKFAASTWAGQTFNFGGAASSTPPTSITFSPHPQDVAAQILGDLVSRIQAEAAVAAPQHGSVFFAVMELSGAGENPVYDALNDIHSNTAVFSYGISDAPKSVSLYLPGNNTGILVSGRPGKELLPPPFNQVPQFRGHEIHHKFVVCGFRGDDPVVYCGSSNLALGGEKANGDNLLAIRDADVATVFVIEALALVDHYEFLNTLSNKTGSTPAAAAKQTDKRAAASAAGWVLGTTNAWTEKYFDPNDLHYADRELFGT